MIQFVKNNQIDKIKWNKCIHGAIHHLVYAESWFLDIVAPEWCALILDDYQYVMPLNIKQKFGINYICQPHFCQQLGVFSNKEITLDIFNKFIKAIPWWILKTDIQTYNTFPIQFKKLRTNYVLSLNQPIEILTQGFDKQQRKNIKKAEAANLQIRVVSNVDNILCLYKESYGDKYYGFEDNIYKMLNQLISEALLLNKVEIYEVIFNHELIAGGIFLKSQHFYHYILGAPSKKGRSLNAIYFLLNYFITTHANETMNLDFEGSSIPSVAYFYKNFGAENVPFTCIHKKWFFI